MKVFILINISFGSVFSSQSHGSPCTVKSGIFGTCVDISSFSKLRSLLADGKISRSDITICNADLRYLCCPFHSFEEELLNRHTTPGVEVSQGTTQEASRITESIFEEDNLSQERKNEGRKLNHKKL